MKKLLELSKLHEEVTELLSGIKKPKGISLCIHLHYADPAISIYNIGSISIDTPIIEIIKNGITFKVDKSIDEIVTNDIIDNIEKVLQ